MGRLTEALHFYNMDSDSRRPFCHFVPTEQDYAKRKEYQKILKESKKEPVNKPKKLIMRMIGDN